jgi:hypothetical protein
MRELVSIEMRDSHFDFSKCAHTQPSKNQFVASGKPLFQLEQQPLALASSHLPSLEAKPPLTRYTRHSAFPLSSKAFPGPIVHPTDAS